MLFACVQVPPHFAAHDHVKCNKEMMFKYMELWQGMRACNNNTRTSWMLRIDGKQKRQGWLCLRVAHADLPRRVTHAFAVKPKLTRTLASISSYSNICPLSFPTCHYSDSLRQERDVKYTMYIYCRATPSPTIVRAAAIFGQCRKILRYCGYWAWQRQPWAVSLYLHL